MKDDLQRELSGQDVFTIGHSNHTIEHFSGLLKQHEVETEHVLHACRNLLLVELVRRHGGGLRQN